MGILTRIQGPMERAVSRDVVKKFLHITTTADDDRVDALILAAEQRLDGANGLLGRALRQQTWRLDLPDWPDDAIMLPLPPTILVAEITYLDSSGDEQTLSSTLYRVISGGELRGDYIVRNFDATWPSVRAGERDAVRVTFDCGYRSLVSPADNPIPEPIIQAIVMMCQSWYDRPGLEDVPEVVTSLISPYRVGRLGPLHSTD